MAVDSTVLSYESMCVNNLCFRGGIILFVCRQPPLIHMVDRFEYCLPFLVLPANLQVGKILSSSGPHRSVGSSVLLPLGKQKSLQLLI